MKYFFYLFIFIVTCQAYPGHPVVASLLGALMIQFMEILLLENKRSAKRKKKRI
jgi:hypothetical protein